MTLSEQILRALEAYGLKAGPHGQWRCNSPFRPGSDSHAFVLRIEGDGRGAYFDHVTGEGGSLEALAERLGIQAEAGGHAGPPLLPINKPSKRVYANLADYATAHGVTREALAAAGWAECEIDGRRAASFHTANGPRYRFLDGKGPPYKSPALYRACWYKLKEAAEAARDLGESLVLCNRHYWE